MAAGRNYVFTVKDNTPTLRAQLKNLPWSEVQAHRSAEAGHGGPGLLGHREPAALGP